MRILLTGVSGQVGSALLPRLQKIGTVIPTDFDTLDFAKPDLLADALDRIAPDLVINPAAYTAVDQAEDALGTATAVNATAPGAIARWAAARGAPLIHFSTDYVFSGAGERPWCEDDTAQPLSAYGATKLAGDHEIQAAGGCHLILRTSWVYAAQGKNFLWTIARLARERKELRIVADQIGAPTSAALLADAVTDIVADGIDHLRKRSAEANGLVHLTASGETSWHGFACAIINGLRARGITLTVEQIVPIRTDEYPTRANRPHNSRLDLGRWRKVFGQTPPHWETALAPVLDEFAHDWRLSIENRR
jgi:dTDP-4-dehydrorhamnose reductase